MTRSKAMTRSKGKVAVELCGAPTKKPGNPPCERTAGWGTKHVGLGPCKLHGGCLPKVEQHYAAKEAISFAVGALGAEVTIDPLDAMLQSVRLAAGVVAYYRRKLHRATTEGEAADHLAAGYIDALRDLNRFSKAALDANVDSRLVAVAERFGDAVVAAIEEGLAELPFLTPAQRTLLAQAVERALSRREPAPPTIEGHELPPGD